MKQALHIFRKDLLRGWPLLLLWTALLAFWIEPVWRDPLYAESLEPLDSLRAGIVVLAAVIGSALVVQHDPLIGVREFWMTRPVRRRSLLAAKAMFVGGFIVLPPLAIQMALLVRYGLPPDRWMVQALEMAIPWASAVVIACLMACWTRNLGGFFAVAAGLILASNLGASAVNLSRAFRHSAGLSPSLLPALGLVAVALLALQYATRRRAAGMLLGAAAVAAFSLGAFRFDLYSRLYSNFTPALPAMRVSLTPGPGRTAYAAERPGSTSGRAMDLWFVTAPLEDGEGLALEIADVVGKIEWDDGRSTPFYTAGEWYVSGHAQPPFLAGWRALGIRGDASFESLLDRSGKLSGMGHASVWQLAASGRLPLEAGVESSHSSSTLRIVGVGNAPGAWSIRLRSRELISLRRPFSRMQIALRNQDRGETIPLAVQGGGGRLIWGGLLVSPPFLLTVKEGVWAPAGRAPIDADWLAGAELLVSHYDLAGSAEVRVEAPNLRVAAEEMDRPTLVASSRAPWF